jgi:hypothetical protein
MGVDRWELEHRSYRPGRRDPEVMPQDEDLDLPDELPVAPPTPRRSATPRPATEAASNGRSVSGRKASKKAHTEKA